MRIASTTATDKLSLASPAQAGPADGTFLSLLAQVSEGEPSGSGPIGTSPDAKGGPAVETETAPQKADAPEPLVSRRVSLAGAASVPDASAAWVSSSTAKAGADSSVSNNSVGESSSGAAKRDRSVNGTSNPGVAVRSYDLSGLVASAPAVAVPFQPDAADPTGTVSGLQADSGSGPIESGAPGSSSALQASAQGNAFEPALASAWATKDSAIGLHETVQGAQADNVLSGAFAETTSAVASTQASQPARGSNSMVEAAAQNPSQASAAANAHGLTSAAARVNAVAAGALPFATQESSGAISPTAPTAQTKQAGRQSIAEPTLAGPDSTQVSRQGSLDPASLLIGTAKLNSLSTNGFSGSLSLKETVGAASSVIPANTSRADSLAARTSGKATTPGTASPAGSGTGSGIGSATGSSAGAAGNTPSSVQASDNSQAVPSHAASGAARASDGASQQAAGQAPGAPIEASALQTAATHRTPIGSDSATVPGQQRAAPASVSASGGESVSTSSVNTAKLMQTMSETEMHVGMRSTEFGDISIRTSITPQQLVAQISLNHGDLSQALSAHVSTMQTRLGEDYGLHTSIEIHNQGSPPSGESGQSSQREQRAFQQSSGSARTPFPSQEESALSTVVPAVAGNGRRLDIRA